MAAEAGVPHGGGGYVPVTRVAPQFTILVNSRPVFVKGVNWIPDDHFLTRITAERVERRLDQALGANVNLIRVWGGGVFRARTSIGRATSVDFWSGRTSCWPVRPTQKSHRCGRRSKPRRARTLSDLRHIRRLCCSTAATRISGATRTGIGRSGSLGARGAPGTPLSRLRRSSRSSIRPPVQREQPVLPGCEWRARPSQRSRPRHPPPVGRLKRIDYEAYRSEIPRFCSEFGFQAPPAWRTLSTGCTRSQGGPLDAERDPKNDPNFLLHQKADDGNGKLDRGLAPPLECRTTSRTGTGPRSSIRPRGRVRIDHYRSMVATDGRRDRLAAQRLLAGHLLGGDRLRRAAQAPLVRIATRVCARNVVFANDNGIVSAVVLNDTDQPWQGELTVSREQFNGRVLSNATIGVSVESRTSTADCASCRPVPTRGPERRDCGGPPRRLDCGAHVRAGH